MLGGCPFKFTLFGVEMEHGGSQGEDSVEIDWGEEGRKHSQDVIYEIRIKKI